MSAVESSYLDNIVWHALQTRHAQLAQLGAAAARYPVAVSSFAAVQAHTQQAFSELADMLQPEDQALLLARQAIATADALRLEPLLSVRQMLDRAEPATAGEEKVVCLGAADAPEMLALAQQTQPGLFGIRTLEMGHCIGIRDQGRLIAMAGERFRVPGFVEISAVCVDAAYRGQGLARSLMNRLRRDIRARGDQAFLHVRDDSAATIALYEHMGFRTRHNFVLHKASRCA